MNVQEISHNDLIENACPYAADSLLWEARQQTCPRDMLHLALAARYAEAYADALRGMIRDKVLAAFWATLDGPVRDEVTSLAPGKQLPYDAQHRLMDFLADVAREHAGLDLEAGAIDCTSPNFPAMIAHCAANVVGCDEYELGSKTARLIRELKSERLNGKAAKEAAPVPDWDHVAGLVRSGIASGSVRTQVTDGCLLVDIRNERFWVQGQGELFVDKEETDVSPEARAGAIVDTLELFYEERDTFPSNYETLCSCIEALEEPAAEGRNEPLASQAVDAARVGVGEAHGKERSRDRKGAGR